MVRFSKTERAVVKEALNYLESDTDLEAWEFRAKQYGIPRKRFEKALKSALEKVGAWGP